MDANPDKIAGVKATFQFNLTGAGGADYYAVLTDGKGEVNQGVADNPDLTVFMEAGDFKDLVGGKLDPMAAFMSGKLKMQGDMSLALKVNSLLG